jgi:hypothetical protein
VCRRGPALECPERRPYIASIAVALVGRQAIPGARVSMVACPAIALIRDTSVRLHSSSSPEATVIGKAERPGSAAPSGPPVAGCDDV